MEQYEVQRKGRFLIVYKDRRSTVHISVEDTAFDEGIDVRTDYFKIIEGAPPDKEVVLKRVRDELLKAYKRVEYWPKPTLNEM